MFSIDEIEQIMEDTAESVEKQKEIDELISGQLSPEDEDDVLQELDQLVSAEAAEAAEEENVTLPEVPTEGKNERHILLFKKKCCGSKCKR